MSADAHDLYKLSRDLENLAIQLESQAQEIAKAKVVKEYDSDRRKQLLSEFVAPLLSKESASAAEHLARANPEYTARFKDLSRDLMAALAVIARSEGTRARFDATQSVLSAQKVLLMV